LPETSRVERVLRLSWPVGIMGVLRLLGRAPAAALSRLAAP
jgi:hypothetical protein